MKICRQYLTHIQNSVFEGEISDSHYCEFISSLKKTIKKDEDSIMIFKLWSSKFKREVIGTEKRNRENII